MKSIEVLAKYLGYYKSNNEFENFLKKHLLNPSKYNSSTQAIICKKSKLEIGFTNERMMRKGDEEKSLMGGKPIFTHFNIYPQSKIIFDALPFNIDFKSNLEFLDKSAGQPDEIYETEKDFIWGHQGERKVVSIICKNLIYNG